MLPACLRLADGLFPRVRAQAARRLVAAGWSQTEAAQALGVSQAMVSKYLAASPVPPSAADDALVARLAEDLVAELESPSAGGGSDGGARGAHDGGHDDGHDAPAPSVWCTTLTVGQDRPEGGAALHDLLTAERRLRTQPPLRVVPQIGLNLARALPTAEREAHVLSYPGRLVAVGARLVPPAPPAFGASGHLARCLLHLRRRDPALLAIANVRGGRDVAAAARRAGWPVAQELESVEGTAGAGRGRRPSRAPRAPRASPRPAASGPPGAPDADARFRALADAASPAAAPSGALRAFHDPGAVGLEACLYIAGPDASAVADAVLRLDALLPLVEP